MLYFVNTGVEESQNAPRDWGLCLKYKFISAGGGATYSDQLQRLDVGSYILAYISQSKNPQGGYVGFGRVVEPKFPHSKSESPKARHIFPIKDLMASEASLREEAEKNGFESWSNTNPDETEWAVKVQWLNWIDPEPGKRWANGLWCNGCFSSRLVVARMDPKKPKVAETIRTLREGFPKLGELFPEL